MNKNKLAYMAGIVDGEGSIRIELQKGDKRGKPDYYWLKLSVDNTSLPLMTWIRENFGGKSLKEKKRIGNCKQDYQWEIKSPKQASNIIKELYPYLIIKRSQAEIASKVGSLLKGSGHSYTTQEREELAKLFYQMKDLNKRGL